VLWFFFHVIKCGVALLWPLMRSEILFLWLTVYGADFNVALVDMGASQL
jgi:hypothetical protein